MSKEQDQIFFRNFSLIVGFLAVLMVIFIVLARIIGIDEVADAERRAPAIAEITAPMGQVSVAGEASAEPSTPVETAVVAGTDETTAASAEGTAPDGGAGAGDKGKGIYDGLCVSCHGVSALSAMIPQFGDKTAWAPRIAQGVDVLYGHALNGFTGKLGMMPAKGGNTNLSDDDVKAAVDYIVANGK